MNLGSLYLVNVARFYAYTDTDGWYVSGKEIQIEQGTPLVLVDERSRKPTGHHDDTFLRFLTPKGPLWCRRGYVTLFITLVS